MLWCDKKNYVNIFNYMRIKSLFSKDTPLPSYSLLSLKLCLLYSLFVFLRNLFLWVKNVYFSLGLHACPGFDFFRAKLSQRGFLYTVVTMLTFEARSEATDAVVGCQSIYEAKIIAVIFSTTFIHFQWNVNIPMRTLINWMLHQDLVLT